MTAKLADGPLEPVPAYQLDLLRRLADESGRRRTVQLPGLFAYSESKRPTPIGTLVRCGDAELRLYLTLVMVTRQGTGSEHLKAWRRPMQDLHLARALGYAPEFRDQDPRRTANGYRLVSRAMDRLEHHGFIARTANEVAGCPDVDVNHLGPTDPKPHITVPLEMWRNGWICRLSKAALAVYLALRRHTFGREGMEVFISPLVREQHYGLSPSTWRRGGQDLVMAGLLETEVKVVLDRRSPERPGTHYLLRPDALKRAPGEG